MRFGLVKFLSIGLAVAGSVFYCSSAAQAPLDYCIILDTGGTVSDQLGVDTRGEVVTAHRGVLPPVSHMAALAINSRQIVVASATVIRNLFTVSGDLTAPERSAWWRKYVYVSEEAAANLKELVETRNPIRVQAVQHVKGTVLPLISSEYTLYVAKTGDLVILLPKGRELKEAGFLAEAVNPVAYADLETLLSTQETYPVEGSHLNALFDTTNKVPKHLFLNGHGFFDKSLFGGSVKPGDEAVIAQLKPADWRAFLQLLILINAESLFNFSCFAGGTNIALMNQKSLDAFGKVLFDLRAIKFPIIMGATTDVPMVSFGGFDPKEGKLVDFVSYFKAIDAYTRRGNQKDLKAAVAALQGSYLMANTPSIRYPGFNTLFRALETDKSIMVLTVTKQKALLLENSKRQLILPAVENGAFLYYPALIKLPLVVPGFHKGDKKLYPFMFSMAQGTFVHTFAKIDASDLTLSEFLCSLMGALSPVKRAFVIDELACKGEAGEKRIIRGLVVKLAPSMVKSPTGVDTQVVLLSVLGREGSSAAYFEAKAPEKYAKIAGGQWYLVASDTDIGSPVPLGRIAQTIWSTIDEKRYVDAAGQIIESTLPDKETLAQATGGQETIEMVKEDAMGIIKDTVAVPVPPVLAEIKK